MQTKKELLDTLPNDVFGDILDQIDFSYLDNFLRKIKIFNQLIHWKKNSNREISMIMEISSNHKQ